VGEYVGVSCFTTNGVELIIGSTKGVGITTDNGAWWDFYNSGLESNGVGTLAVKGIYLFAGTGVGVFRSSNHGLSWSPVNSGFGRLTNVDAFALRDTNIFVATSVAGLFISTDNGTNWLQANGGLNSDGYNRVNSFLTDGQNLFAGTSGPSRGHVFLSRKDSNDWVAVDAGLPEGSVYALAKSGSFLFAGTYGFGIWKRPISEMVTAIYAKVPAMPSRVSIAQNYPNPFNPSTTIKYDLPMSAEVRVSVYDLLGREVSVLVNDRREAGVHEVKFDGSNLASGVYFYRLQTGDFVATKRLLLLK
jgi:hypothetical protein